MFRNYINNLRISETRDLRNMLISVLLFFCLFLFTGWMVYRRWIPSTFRIFLYFISNRILREFITYISYFLVPQTKDYSITVQPRFHFSEPNLTGNLSTLNQKDKTKEEILSLFPSESWMKRILSRSYSQDSVCDRGKEKKRRRP